MAVTDSPDFQKDTVGLLHGPKSTSEEDILQYWRERTGSTWHMCGTVRMGREGEERTGVDREFRVLGTKRLRVVDLSIMPILPKWVAFISLVAIQGMSGCPWLTDIL